jgi:hypothetical protein
MKQRSSSFAQTCATCLRTVESEARRHARTLEDNPKHLNVTYAAFFSHRCVHSIRSCVVDAAHECTPTYQAYEDGAHAQRLVYAVVEYAHVYSDKVIETMP